MIKKIEKRLVIRLKDMTEDKIQDVVDENIKEAEQVMGHPLGHRVDVRRDPVDPTKILVDLEITPVQTRSALWCWDCGQPSYIGYDEELLACYCGSTNMHDRPRTNLDAMAGAVTNEEG